MNPPRFKCCDRDTLYLMPPSIHDWLPRNHLARFIVEVVTKLDLRPIENAYDGRGSEAYSPTMLVALLFYGYATGVFSSRKLELATHESVAFRYITANQHPDHDTIAAFRKRFLEELKPLFAQILMIAQTMGIAKLGQVALDGTKIKANASQHKALSWDHACKLEQQIQAEVDSLLRQAEVADREAVPEGMSIPEELSRRGKRLETIELAKREIERRAAERYAKEQEVYDQKMAERYAKEQEGGKKPRGREPKPPESGPKKTDQVNLTDEDSRIMPAAGGTFEQAYNAQAGVDLSTMLIVENHVTQHPNDKQEIQTTLENLISLPDQLGTVDTLVADSGYFSEANLDKCAAEQITPYIAVNREKHNIPLEERFAQPEPLPEEADVLTRMKHRLKTSEGKKIYAQRKSTVRTAIRHYQGHYGLSTIFPSRVRDGQRRMEFSLYGLQLKKNVCPRSLSDLNVL